MAASFLTSELGWVVGIYMDNRDPIRPRRNWRVVTTYDDGRTARA